MVRERETEGGGDGGRMKEGERAKEKEVEKQREGDKRGQRENGKIERTDGERERDINIPMQKDVVQMFTQSLRM